MIKTPKPCLTTDICTFSAIHTLVPNFSQQVPSQFPFFFLWCFKIILQVKYILNTCIYNFKSEVHIAVVIFIHKLIKKTHYVGIDSIPNEKNKIITLFEISKHIFVIWWLIGVFF